MKRRLFNLLAGISLMLCVVTAVLWVRSHYVRDLLTGGIGDRRFVWLGFSNGEFQWIKARLDLPTSSVVDSAWRVIHDAPSTIDHSGLITDTTTHRLGFALHVDDTKAVISFPLWALVLLLSILPLKWVAVRARKETESKCSACGYDLRATPDRCPECGTPAKVE